jgi:hypothetical protein
VTDTTLYTPAFDMAFAAALAEQTCEKITQSTEKLRVCVAQYRTAIRDAAAANALEQASEAIGDDTWVMARAL